MPQLGKHTVYRTPTVHAEFKLDRDGWRKIALSAPIRKIVHDVAEHHARPIAERLAAEFTDTGNYLRSFHVNDTQIVAGPPQWKMLRAAAQLYNNATNPGDDQSYAHAVEVGNYINPNGHHVFSKTLMELVATGAAHMTPKAKAAVLRQMRRKPKGRARRRR